MEIFLCRDVYLRKLVAKINEETNTIEIIHKDDINGWSLYGLELEPQEAMKLIEGLAVAIQKAWGIKNDRP